MQRSSYVNVTHQSRPTVTELKNCVLAIGAGLPRGSKLIVVPQKAPVVQKAAVGHFKHAV